MCICDLLDFLLHRGIELAPLAEALSFVFRLIIWGTEIEVVVYPSMLKSIIRQASVGPPIAVLDTLLLTFDQILKLCLQMNKEINEKRKYLTLRPVTWKRGEILGWLIKGKIHREQTPFWQKLAARQF